MTNKWLQTAAIHVASLLAPSEERAEWLEWWCSDLSYVSPHEATRFCLGAFRDALWLRRNRSSLVKRTRRRLQSPFGCLAALSTLSGLSVFAANRLERTLPLPGADGTSGVASVCDILFLYLVLAATAFIIRDSPGNPRGMPRPNTVRSWIFLAVKIGLVLPILQCFLIAVAVLDLPFLSLGFYAGCVLVFRWIFIDQRRRCPVCLRLLTEPIRIGTASETFLQWYGAESMCARGHGLLHAPGISASYSREHDWIDLDDSWRALHSESAVR